MRCCREMTEDDLCRKCQEDARSTRKDECALKNLDKKLQTDSEISRKFPTLVSLGICWLFCLPDKAEIITWSSTQHSLIYSNMRMINKITFYLAKRILQSTGYKFDDVTPDAINMIWHPIYSHREQQQTLVSQIVRSLTKTSLMAAVLAHHIMVLPFPAQGHVIPLMELSHRLVQYGFTVYYINTEFNHDRMLKSMEDKGAILEGIHMLSVPDGLDPDDDHTDIGKFVGGLPAAMFAPLEEIIRTKKIKWVIADVSMSWALELSNTAGVRIALFSTYAASVFALRMKLPKLIENGVIDESGNVKRQEMIQLMPPIDSTEIPWVSLGNTLERRRINIRNVLKTNQLMTLAEVIICNTFREVESETLALVPNVFPVGPLIAAMSRPTGHFLPEDLACLSWLDAQAPSSVVYVAFGSSAVFEVTKFQELADGLVLSGCPFLWVVRPNFTKEIEEEWFDQYKHRMNGKGLVVAWAPQQRVLSHPSVACFVTHCGWNSTMEGLMHGVPFLCCPYFADQFCNQSYVCNVWKTGLKLCANEQGVITKEEITNKIAQLMGDEEIKARALTWKSKACASMRQGGSSHQNLLHLVNLLKGV